jgi:hypothetical protein
MAGRIWVKNRVDFSNPRNMLTIAAELTVAAGDVRRLMGAPRRAISPKENPR